MNKAFIALALAACCGSVNPLAIHCPLAAAIAALASAERALAEAIDANNAEMEAVPDEDEDLRERLEEEQSALLGPLEETIRSQEALARLHSLRGEQTAP